MVFSLRNTTKLKLKNKPRGLYFSKALFEGLIFGGVIFGGAYLRFKIDWDSVIVGRKFTVFALLYFVCD